MVPVVDQMSRISTRILLREPFYGHFMLGMPKAIDNAVDTACVSLLNKNIVKLSINETYWLSLDESKQYGLIKHEVLHVVLRHLFMLHEYSHPHIFNIAADLVVNQYIPSEQLPEGAITLNALSYLRPVYGIKLEPLRSTRYYYQKLMEAMQSTPNCSQADYENNHGEISGLSELMDPVSPEQKKHCNWQEFEKLGSATLKIMEYQLHNQVKSIMVRLKQHEKGLGNLPGHFVEYLNAFLSEYKAQVDWRRVVKRFAASSTSTYIKNTLRRPSKRYGTTPGIKVRRHHRLLIALDTSASVPNEDIQTFFGELDQIWRNGAQVIIAECDTDIQKTYEYSGKVPVSVSGRGGTNFTAPILLANNEIRPDGIIYFTDGEASAPEVKSRCSILWVITSNGIEENSDVWNELPGQKVQIIT